MSAFGRLYRGETNIDFPRAWRIFTTIPVLLLFVWVGSLYARGLHLGIDFEGGTVWELPAPDVTVEEARDALDPVGEASARVQIVGGENLRVQSGSRSAEEAVAVAEVLADVAGVEVADVSVSTVGPSWGDEITESAIRALALFFVAISIYISVRLEWRMAVGAIAAVVHDVIVSVGVYLVFQFEVTPATVISFLTILGYSLYDTVVVYDKVRENGIRLASSGRMTYTDMMNLSLNQVLMRSINTTVVAVLPVVSMLVVGDFILGAVTLQEFSIALMVGLLAGAYSSFFVAAPIVAFLKEREPKNRALRQRLEARGDIAPSRTKAAPAEVGASAEAPVASGSADRTATGTISPSRSHPPRPRKKTKKPR